MKLKKFRNWPRFESEDFWNSEIAYDIDLTKMTKMAIAVGHSYLEL